MEKVLRPAANNPLRFPGKQVDLFHAFIRLSRPFGLVIFEYLESKCFNSFTSELQFFGSQAPTALAVNGGLILYLKP